MMSAPEKKAYDRARYLANRDATLARAKCWYAGNTERKRAYDVNYRPTKNKRRRNQYAANPELFREDPTRRRGHHLSSTYRMTVAAFEARFDAQGRKCACCGSTESKGFNWCVDHDHVTGDVRGILCVTCNTGIGMLGDNSVGVSNAVAYLDSSAPRVDEHW